KPVQRRAEPPRNPCEPDESFDSRYNLPVVDRTTPPKLDRVLRSYLKLRHLRLLVLLDDTRSLRRAAALLGISQPATSKALSEIESAFGLQLFERSGGGTRPTLYGEVVVRFARNVLAEF